MYSCELSSWMRHLQSHFLFVPTPWLHTGIQETGHPPLLLNITSFHYSFTPQSSSKVYIALPYTVLELTERGNNI